METLAVQMLDLLSGKLGSRAFESIVRQYWDSGEMLQRYEGVEDLVSRIQDRVRAGKLNRHNISVPDVEFESIQLFGSPGFPHGIHIRAPGEVSDSPCFCDRNRPPHTHDSGRITIITQGRAIFYVLRELGGKSYVIEMDTCENDIILWPAQAAHTFHAGENGFSLLSIMGREEACHADSYPTSGRAAKPDFDCLPRMSYPEYLDIRLRGH